MNETTCKTCGDKPDFPGVTRCANCWETERRLDDYLRSAAGQRFTLIAMAKALFVPRYCALIREMSGFTTEATTAWVRAAEAVRNLDDGTAVAVLLEYVRADEHDSKKRKCEPAPSQGKVYAEALKVQVRKPLEIFDKLLRELA